MSGTIIDTVILALLAGTIFYAWLLDRRLRKLMAVLQEMKPMVGEFSDAVDRSERSVHALQAVRVELPTPAQAVPKRDAAKPAAKVPPARTPSSPAKTDLVRNFFDMTRDTVS